MGYMIKTCLPAILTTNKNFQVNSMSVFILAFIIFSLVALGMSVGVIFSNREIKGSCGGIGNITGESSNCSCSNPCDKKKARLAKEQATDEVKESPIEFRKM